MSLERKNGRSEPSKGKNFSFFNFFSRLSRAPPLPLLGLVPGLPPTFVFRKNHLASCSVLVGSIRPVRSPIDVGLLGPEADLGTPVGVLSQDTTPFSFRTRNSRINLFWAHRPLGQHRFLPRRSFLGPNFLLVVHLKVLRLQGPLVRRPNHRFVAFTPVVQQISDTVNWLGRIPAPVK